MMVPEEAFSAAVQELWSQKYIFCSFQNLPISKTGRKTNCEGMGVLRALWHALSTDRVGRRDHTDIGVTLNTYTHLGLIDAEQELERMKKEVRMSDRIERRKRRRKSAGE